MGNLSLLKPPLKPVQLTKRLRPFFSLKRICPEPYFIPSNSAERLSPPVSPIHSPGHTKGMSPPQPYLKLALKLIEMFSWQDNDARGFQRYWHLAGPLEAFSASAQGRIEQDIANALRAALEGRLRYWAGRSLHEDASAVAEVLGVRPRQRWRRPRRPAGGKARRASKLKTRK